ELTQANNDLTNLLTSTAIPVVMVGGDLRIRRFTEPAKKAMSLLPGDIGRPIGDIRPSAQVPDLESLLIEVIDKVQPGEREVGDREGRRHIIRDYTYHKYEQIVDSEVR